MLDHGWTFERCEGSDGDALYGSDYAHQLYTRAEPTYSGRVTVPILWDRQTGTIVSNESSEIIRMLNSAFDGITGSRLDLCPEVLRSEIDVINERVYHTINNGVYRCGFATSHDAYQEAFDELFGSLDWVRVHLEYQPLPGGQSNYRGRLATLYDLDSLRCGLCRAL